MKRLLLGMMVVGGAALLGGCPIYPDNNSYVQCQTAYDCGPGYACAPRGECVPSAPYYADDASPSGECGFCPTGTVCTLANQTLQCLPPLLPETDASIDIGDASSSFDASLFDAAFTLDATPEDVGFVAEAGGGATCNSDAQCATTVGAKCIDGLCAAQSQLCSDGTQCLVAGDSCVDGTCVPPCSHAAPFCPTGYQCDFNRSACSVNPGVCASTGDCQGGAVCVDTHCVAPCSSADAGSQCVAGQVCVNGGCIPDQQARFACRNDGNQGSLANSCDPDSVCLHGDCYPGCDAEGGGCAATGESCKGVTIAKGTFAVCGANANLGSDCDPAVGRYCVSPKACVNGYCL